MSSVKGCFLRSKKLVTRRVAAWWLPLTVRGRPTLNCAPARLAGWTCPRGERVSLMRSETLACLCAVLGLILFLSGHVPWQSAQVTGLVG